MDTKMPPTPYLWLLDQMRRYKCGLTGPPYVKGIPILKYLLGKKKTFISCLRNILSFRVLWLAVFFNYLIITSSWFYSIYSFIYVEGKASYSQSDFQFSTLLRMTLASPVLALRACSTTTLNSWPYCFPLKSTENTGVWHHIWVLYNAGGQTQTTV